MGVTIAEVVEWDSAWWGAIGQLTEAVAAEGETYALAGGLTEAELRDFWCSNSTVLVAHDGDDFLGVAKYGPNRPAQGAHIGTASFMVAPSARGRGVGRLLGEEVVRRCQAEGLRGIQFNAVVDSNIRAVRLWQSLGFEVIGTVPGAFRRPSGEYAGLHVMFRPLSGAAVPLPDSAIAQ